MTPGHSLLTLLVALHQRLPFEPRPGQPLKGCQIGFLSQEAPTQTPNPPTQIPLGLLLSGLAASLALLVHVPPQGLPDLTAGRRKAPPTQKLSPTLPSRGMPPRTPRPGLEPCSMILKHIRMMLAIIHTCLSFNPC